MQRKLDGDLMRAFLLVLALTLAGCSGAPDVAQGLQVCAEDSCQATVVLENETAPTEFELRGVVVDQVIVPVPHAEVELRKLTKPLASVTADKDGAFTFRGLAEGFYNLYVEKDGHTGVLSNVYVKEAVKAAMVQIVRIPPPVPTHAIYVWDGMVDCSYLVAGLGLSGLCPHEFVLGSSNQTASRSFYEETLGVTPDWIQAEMYWKPNQLVGDTLRLRGYAIDGSERTSLINSIAGTSPLVLSYDNATIGEYGLGAANGVYLGAGGGSPDLASVTVVQDQPFTVYYSVMSNLVPPEDWMFVTDGALA